MMAAMKEARKVALLVDLKVVHSVLPLAEPSGAWSVASKAELMGMMMAEM
jgi:hypothetical protein